MKRIGATITAVALALLLATCGGSRHQREIEQTAHWTEAYRNGIRPADPRDGITALLEKYAVENGGQLLSTASRTVVPSPATWTYGSLRISGLGGHDPQCWRFEFRQEGNDQYVRQITDKQIDCPPNSTPTAAQPQRTNLEALDRRLRTPRSLIPEWVATRFLPGPTGCSTS